MKTLFKINLLLIACSINPTLSMKVNAQCNLIVVPLIDNDDCSPDIRDGAIGLTVSGGKIPYTYLWNTGATTKEIYGLSKSTYTVTITDALGCTYSSSLNVGDGQCCHDNNNDFPYVDIIANLTTPQVYYIPQGVNYDLNKDLIIPNGVIVVFNNNILKINRRVQIHLNRGAGLKILNNSNFSACNKMWKGIYTEDGPYYATQLIEIDNSTIKDADKAVFVADGYEVEVNNSTFDNNIVGIETKYYTNSISVEICDRLRVYGSNFIHSSPLLNPYVGQAAIKTKPYAGMIVRSFKGTGGTSYCNYVIGDNTTTLNTFSNLNNGIQFINCQAPKISNSRFSNIASENFYPGKFMGSAIYCTNSTGLNYQTSPLIVTPRNGQSLSFPTFNSCKYGIYTDNCMANLSNLIMNNVYIGIEARNAVDLSPIKNGYEIYNNDIQASYIGIALTNNYQAVLFNVSENHVNISPTGGIGIMDHDNSLHVTRNLIMWYNHIGGSQNGIDLLNLRGVKRGDIQITNNEIVSTSNLITKFIGLKVGNCSFNYLVGNRIFGAGPTPPHPSTGDKSHGMFFSKSFNNTIDCNYIDNTSYGIGFYGELPELDFAGNVMNHHFEGLHLHTDAVIGPQVRRGNTWLDPTGYTYGGFGAVNMNTIGFNALKKSEFKVQTTTILPLTYSPTIPGFDAGWFTPDAGKTYSCCELCDIISNSEEITQLDIEVAQGHSITSEWTDESLHMAEIYLYKKLYDHPELLDVDSILPVFFENHQFLAAGVINNVANFVSGIEAYNLYYNGLLNTADSLIAIESDSIAIIDSIRIAIGNDTIYSFEKNNLTNQIQILIDTKVNIGLQRDAIINNDLAAASVENDAFNPTGLPDTNAQIINGIYLKSISREFIEYTQEEIDQLIYIAQQCPYSGGSAVYDARAIVFKDLDEEKQYDDAATCLAQGIFRTSSSTEKESGINFTLSPNPAFDNVAARFNFENNFNYSLAIFDKTGRFIKRFNIPPDQSTFNFNISDLYSGMYVVNLIANDLIVDKTKLVIIK